ncbi:MAG TPA: hypothetical protein VMV29_10260 [Ktedonobacterales bacterium]|nr:hypothetical protein [Ktedonobacterales bacterium]
MNTVVVVNGEHDWAQYLPGVAVERIRLQSSRWLYDGAHASPQADGQARGKLWVFDDAAGLAVQVTAVLWRVGAIRPQPAHRTALELIRLAGIPCVNPARTLLRGFDRLAMLNELREIGIPTLPFSVALGDGTLEQLRPNLPAVLKVGALHAGLGKARILDAAAWADARDLAFAADDYATVEPYIAYTRDIRCLAVGDQMWAMSRHAANAGWKVNAGQATFELIEPPAILRDYTLRTLAHFGADILGLDFLETPEGGYVCLESNDVPGFSGFPPEARLALARRMRERMEGAGGANLP